MVGEISLQWLTTHKVFQSKKFDVDKCILVIRVP